MSYFLIFLKIAWGKIQRKSSFSCLADVLSLRWTPCAALGFLFAYLCGLLWHLKDIFHHFSCVFFHTAERCGHWEGLLAASSEQWPRLGRILHVFPVALSFSMLLSVQLIVRRYQRGPFSQDPQHTATHSDGVTRPSQQSPLCLRPGAQPRSCCAY